MTCFIICQLQQFRQKKDSKGNNSKPSGKAGKSGRDTTVGTVTEAEATQQHAADGEISKHDAEDTIAFSESSSGVDSAASDTAAGTSGHDTTVGTATDAAVAQQHAAGGYRSKHDAEDTITLSESSSGVDSVASDTVASKSGHDTTAGPPSEAAVTQQHAADGERYKHDADDTIALSDSSSRVDSVASDTAAATDELSGKAGIVIASIPGAAEFPLEGSGVDDTRLNQSADDGRDVDSGVTQKDGSASLVLEDTTNNVPAMILREKLADSSISLPIEFSSRQEREHGEEQVTDVGLCLHS